MNDSIFRLENNRLLHWTLTPVKAYIRDRNKLWSFQITDQEYEELHSGVLQVFWSKSRRMFLCPFKTQGKTVRPTKKIIEDVELVCGESFTKRAVCLEHIRRKHPSVDIRASQIPSVIRGRGWCLVTKKQRSLLLDSIDYDTDQAFFKLSSQEQQEWASIKRLESLEHENSPTCLHCFRRFEVVKRTPIVSAKLKKRKEQWHVRLIWKPYRNAIHILDIPEPRISL